MHEKKYDPFFDEEKGADREKDRLMEMIEKSEREIVSFSPGTKVEGTVSRIGSEYIFVEIGAKNEAMIKAQEYMGDEGITVNVGDRLEGYILSDKDGEIIVSKSMGGYNASVGELMDAQRSRIPVQGKVTGINKGGLNVKIMGHRAFCPLSQVEVKFVENINVYLGKTMDFVITRITEGGRNIVLSRIPLLESGLEEQIEKLSVAASGNAEMKGTISKITDFGLFVGIGDLEGLVHISEVSWERAQNLESSFQVGQEVRFIVLKVEKKDPLKNTKISLSIRKVLDDPWKNVPNTFSHGQVVEGTITKIAKFGAFVELIPGVEGLIHISEMSWGKRVNHPSEVVEVGQAVTVTILAVDEKKRAVSLSLKNIKDDPWNDIEQRLPVGTNFAGVIAKKAKFGYFVDLFEGVTGLMVFQNITEEKRDSLKAGDNVEVYVESIDKDNRRISLSMGISHEGKKSEEPSPESNKSDNPPDKNSTEFGDALIAALKAKKWKNTDHESKS